MNIEHYREFIVLAEELNFRSAAKRLCLSQSALSKHVLALEQHYGVRLFDRTTIGVSLTIRGSALLENATEIWNAYERSIKAMSQYAEESSTLFLGGVLDNPVEYPIVAATLNRFRDVGNYDTPHFLHFTSADIEAQAEQLRTGNADCVVFNMTQDMLESLPDAGRFEYEPLCLMPLDAIVRKESPLASHKGIGIRDLFGTTLIQLIGQHFTASWKQIETQLIAAGVSFKTMPVAVTSTYDYVAMDPKDAVLLATRMASLSVSLQHPDTVRVPIRADELSLSLCALYLKEARSKALSDFLACLQASYHEAYYDAQPE